jgi:hypothetical protein
MAREGEAGAVEPLGDIARRIDADEEEGHALLPGLLQRGEPVRGLLEAGAELAGQHLDIVAPLLHRAGEGGVGHQHRRRRIARQRAVGETAAIVGGEAAVAQQRVDVAAQLQIDELLGELEVAAGAVHRLVEEDLAAVPVEPAQRSHHHVGGKGADAQLVPRLVISRKPARLADPLVQQFGGVVEDGEAVAPRREEAPRLGHRVGDARPVRPPLGIAVGKRQLLLLIGGVEPQERFRHAGIVGRDVLALQRR